MFLGNLSWFDFGTSRGPLWDHKRAQRAPKGFPGGPQEAPGGAKRPPGLPQETVRDSGETPMSY